MPGSGTKGGSTNGGSPPWTERTDRRGLTHFRRHPSLHERRRERALTDWYGQDLAPAEIAAHRAPARPLGVILDEALQGLGLAELSWLQRLRQVWPLLVGAEVARSAVPASLRQGVLNVEVASSTRRYMLEREERTALSARLRQETGGAVTAVRFVPPGRWLGPEGAGAGGRSQ